MTKKLTPNVLREKFLQYYAAREHVVIPSAALVPENDPSTLFTSSGMQPLVPYLLGQEHPLGTRLCDAQKCFRSNDIEEVGDARHTTFFEMLGNWSLGSYFKAEQIPWIWGFLTQEAMLPAERLYVTVFAGNQELGMAQDDEAIALWQKLFAEAGLEARVELDAEKNGMSPGARIFTYGEKKNWWSRSGTPEMMPVGEPGGPDSEIFYDFGAELRLHEQSQWAGQPCHVNCDCGRYVEIGNSVFMQYRRRTALGGDFLRSTAPTDSQGTDSTSRDQSAGAPQKSSTQSGPVDESVVSSTSQDQPTGTPRKSSVGQGSSLGQIGPAEGKATQPMFEPLQQKNVDYGGGLERLVMAVENKDDIFLTSTFTGLINKLEQISGHQYAGAALAEKQAFRVIADHIRATVMLMADGVRPSNKEQGYVLRRLIRRSIRWGRRLGLAGEFLGELAVEVMAFYQDHYVEVGEQKERILAEIRAEEQKFGRTIEKGLREIEKTTRLDGAAAFRLYESFGFPWELTAEIAAERGESLAEEEFKAAMRAHQDKSREAGGKFRGGLADAAERTVQFHTATHLLHQALRDKFGLGVQQKGSNITAERARFDFSFARALTREELTELEEMINQWIVADREVRCEQMGKEAAVESGALHFFIEKYPDEVSVYTVENGAGGAISREICMGPHVRRTGEVGRVRILKEKASAAGVRRIYLEKAD